MSNSAQDQVINQPAAKEPPIIKESSKDTGSVPTAPGTDVLHKLLTCAMLLNYSICKSRCKYPLADSEQPGQLLISAAKELRELVGGEDTNFLIRKARLVVPGLPYSNVTTWLNDRLLFRFTQSHSTTCQTYPALTSDWSTIDPLMPKNNPDNKTRYFAEWQYQQNSCAIDVLLVLAVQLDAYRICADQCRVSKPTNTAVILLRIIALIPWGTISQAARTEIRESLRRCIARHSFEYRNPLKPRTVQDTYPILFAQMPQVSSLTVRRSWCCDKSDATYFRFSDTCLWKQALQATVAGNPDVTVIVKSDSEGETETRTVSNKRLKARVSAEPPQAAKYNIADALRNVFRVSTDRRKSIESCSKEPCCTELSTEVIVLGRLSPTLVVDLSGLPGEWDLSDPGPICVEYSYMDPSVCDATITSLTANYSLEAVVYSEPNIGDYPGHFSMESKIKQDFFKKQMHHDMMLNGGLCNTKCIGGANWTIQDRRPTLLVFRLCGKVGG